MVESFFPIAPRPTMPMVLPEISTPFERTQSPDRVLRSSEGIVRARLRISPNVSSATAIEFAPRRVGHQDPGVPRCGEVDSVEPRAIAGDDLQRGARPDNVCSDEVQPRDIALAVAEQSEQLVGLERPAVGVVHGLVADAPQPCDQVAVLGRPDRGGCNQDLHGLVPPEVLRRTRWTFGTVAAVSSWRDRGRGRRLRR